jgi:hypothetical protein
MSVLFDPDEICVSPNVVFWELELDVEAPSLTEHRRHA